MTVSKLTALSTYLDLLRDYGKVLASSPLVLVGGAYEMQGPTFDEFLRERGYSRLADFAAENPEECSQPSILCSDSVVDQNNLAQTVQK